MNTAAKRYTHARTSSKKSDPTIDPTQSTIMYTECPKNIPPPPPHPTFNHSFV